MMADARRGARRRAGGKAPAAAATGAERGSSVGEVVRIPAWLPPVLYALLTLWLFRAFVFSDDMLRGGDTESLGYMARKFYADALRAGDFPLWNPLILGGTPFLESLAGGDSLYPTSLLLLVMEPYRALGWKLILHVFLAGLFMFGWVRALGPSRAAAFVAGAAYAVAPFLVSFVSPGHDGKLFVTALAPLLFWAVERTFLRDGLLPFVSVALVVALVLLTTHFQMAYFLFGSVGIYYILRVLLLWRGSEEVVTGEVDAGGEIVARRRRAALTRLGLFLGAALVGAAAAGVQLAPAVDYVTKYSRRTATTVGASTAENVVYSSSYSLHPEDMVSFVVPEFAGNRARDNAGGWADSTYWGRNFYKDNTQYTGLVVLLLAGLAFCGGARRSVRWILLCLGSFALLYALGRHTPVWRITFELLPGVSLFRAPDMASVLFGFALVTLAAFGVDRALEMASGSTDAVADRRGMLWLWSAVGGVLLLMLLLASGALLSFWTGAIYPDMQDFQLQALQRASPFIARGALVAALLACASAGAIWAGRKRLLQPVGVVALLTLLVVVDALRIDAAFIETREFSVFVSPDANIEYLKMRQREGELFRVASLQLAGQDVTPAMHGIEMATGHHPNDLARYRELTGMRGSGLPENFFEGADIRTNSVMRLLNIRYLVVPAEMGELPGVDPVSQTQLGGRPWERVYAIDGLPRARLVSEAVIVPDDQAVARILDPAFDVGRTAVLAEAPPVALSGGEVIGEVSWIERGVDRMSLRVTSDRPALLIIADNWFPSWHARVDGQEVPVLRAYHTLRAVPVGPGAQTVELYYESALLRGSLMLSLATLALLLIVGGVSFLRSRGRDAARAQP